MIYISMRARLTLEKYRVNTNCERLAAEHDHLAYAAISDFRRVREPRAANLWRTYGARPITASALTCTDSRPCPMRCTRTQSDPFEHRADRTGPLKR